MIVVLVGHELSRCRHCCLLNVSVDALAWHGLPRACAKACLNLVQLSSEKMQSLTARFVSISNDFNHTLTYDLDITPAHHRHHANFPVGKSAELLMMMLTMTPKMPRAEPKISTIRILTKSDGSCASASAQAEPATPTQMLQGMRGRRGRGARQRR